MNNKSLIEKTYWSALGSLLSSVGRMAAAIFLARQLGPDLAGSYFFYVWLIEFILIIIFFGMPGALTRYLAEFIGGEYHEKAEQLVRWVVRKYITILLLTLTSVIFLATLVFKESEDILILIVLAILLFLQAISGLINAYISGLQKFKRLAKVNLTTSISLLIFQPVMSIWFGLTGALVGCALSYLCAIIWLKPIISIVRIDGISSVPNSFISYSKYTWLASIVSAIVWAKAELFFINQLSTSVQAGYYNVGLILSSFVVIGAGMLTGALMPHFSAAHAKNDLKSIQLDYSRFTTFVAIFALPICLFSVALMPELVPFIFGNSYYNAIPVASLIMITGMFAISGTVTSVLQAFGKSRIIFLTGLFGAVIITIGCLILVPKYGAIGAAWIRLITQALMVTIGGLYVHYKLNIILPYNSLLRLAAAALIAATLIHYILISVSFYPALLSVFFGVIGYIALLRLFRPLSNSDVEFIFNITDRFPKKTRAFSNLIINKIFTKP